MASSTMRIELEQGDEIVAVCPQMYMPPNCVGAYLVFTRSGRVWQVRQLYTDGRGSEFEVHAV